MNIKIITLLLVAAVLVAPTLAEPVIVTYDPKVIDTDTLQGLTDVQEIIEENFDEPVLVEDFNDIDFRDYEETLVVLMHQGQALPIVGQDAEARYVILAIDIVAALQNLERQGASRVIPIGSAVLGNDVQGMTIDEICDFSALECKDTRSQEEINQELVEQFRQERDMEEVTPEPVVIVEEPEPVVEEVVEPAEQEAEVQEEPEVEQTCTGCLSEGICNELGSQYEKDGTRVYCGEQGEQVQKGQGSTCLLSYECQSGMCSDGTCGNINTQTGFFDRIFSWFGSWF